MASIFKKQKTVKGAPYFVQYTDENGKRKTVKGYSDKSLTEQMAAKLELEARMKKTGMVDPEIDHFRVQKLLPIEQHQKAFEKKLSDRSEKYQAHTNGRIKAIIEGCDIKTLADLKLETVQDHLRSYAKTKKLTNRTYNHYVQAIDAFCNWCVKSKRLPANPLAGLERRNNQIGIKQKRRALKPDEIQRLIDAATNSRKWYQRYNGQTRARIYLMAYMTGLRKNELSSLTPESFDLDSPMPTVTVEAHISKHRKKDLLPLHADLARQVREWLKDIKPGKKLFPLLDKRKTWLMIKHDLKAAGIPYRTAEGVADFHAAGRHTYITELLRNGVSLPEARELARHSDINMTMRYTHIGLEDQSRAIQALPALQMRCISSDFRGLSEALTDTQTATKNATTTWQASDCGTQCHCRTNPQKVEAGGIEPPSCES